MSAIADSGAAEVSPQSAAPLVSIVVPSFNGAPWLREALDSLLAQTYPNIEILLLDDASTDDTPAIAAEYEGRIRYIRQPQNMGIYDNVNVGIAEAKGELIATYHADDIYLPTHGRGAGRLSAGASGSRCSLCQRHIGRRRMAANMAGSSFRRKCEANSPLPYPVVLNTLLSYKNNFLVCPTAMVRASVHRDVGVYRQDKYRNTSDLEMWLRIARRYPDCGA